MESWIVKVGSLWAASVGPKTLVCVPWKDEAKRMTYEDATRVAEVWDGKAFYDGDEESR